MISDFCVIRQSAIESGARVGPFAQLRPASTVRENAQMSSGTGEAQGTRRSVADQGGQPPRVSWGRDDQQKVNVGAGDDHVQLRRRRRNATVIEDGAFIGSDSQLIAPVRVGKDAYVAAGSSITDDVPADSLAIARGNPVDRPDGSPAPSAKKQD